MTDELTCQELVELITNYLEDALPVPERARFEAHLSWCPGCHNYLAQMQQTITVVGSLREEYIPESDKARLLELFRDWKRGSGSEAD